MNLWFHKW